MDDQANKPHRKSKDKGKKSKDKSGPNVKASQFHALGVLKDRQLDPMMLKKRDCMSPSWTASLRRHLLLWSRWWDLRVSGKPLLSNP
uniref:GTP binding protein Bms1 n=1 Tax=Coccidioides posadasii RMSCC 3488 TaxID=454284 RepID=A0A0J6FNR2_COCPO|nr:GTP binding protein Bms1 [Coccidioides posadasii RMSCC 3488]